MLLVQSSNREPLFVDGEMDGFVSTTKYFPRPAKITNQMRLISFSPLLEGNRGSCAKRSKVSGLIIFASLVLEICVTSCVISVHNSRLYRMVQCRSSQNLPQAIKPWKRQSRAKIIMVTKSSWLSPVSASKIGFVRLSPAPWQQMAGHDSHRLSTPTGCQTSFSQQAPNQ